MTLTPKPGVCDIAPYVAGTTSTSVDQTDLSSNESAIGPSPIAVRALIESAKSASRYPDSSARLLREALSLRYHIDATRIVCGNGSNELLSLMAKAYVRPGDEVLFGQYAFLVYRLATLSSSGIPTTAPEPGFRIDVEEMLARTTSKTRLVYLANPNNPTGTYIPGDEVRRLRAGLSPEVLLVIDSAYAEYVERDDYDDGLDLAEQLPNVVVTRTFSKVYGLAGLRIGWAYCPVAIADVLNRVRDPFNVSITAQCAAAAALLDTEHVRLSVAHNELWRLRVTSALRELGLTVVDSVGNFILIQFCDGPTACEAYRFLCGHGLILRGVANYGLSDCLRMTIGSEAANRRVISALGEFISTR